MVTKANVFGNAFRNESPSSPLSRIVDCSGTSVKTIYGRVTDAGWVITVLVSTDGITFTETGHVITLTNPPSDFELTFSSACDFIQLKAVSAGGGYITATVCAI